MKKKVRWFVFWPPRILSVLFIALLIYLSAGHLSVRMGWQQFLTDLLLYNIPTLVLMVVLIVSWEIEILGGILYLLAGAGYPFYAASLAGTRPWLPSIPWEKWTPWCPSVPILGHSFDLAVVVPLLLTGILFVINWIWKRKIKAAEEKLRPS